MRTKAQDITEKQASFIFAYCNYGNISKAAKMVGVHRNTASRWLKAPLVQKVIADYKAGNC